MYKIAHILESVVVCLMLLAFSGCHEMEHHLSEKEIISVDSMLGVQLSLGLDCKGETVDGRPYMFTKDDLKAVAPLILGEVCKMGFKHDPDSFKARIKRNLGIDVKNTSCMYFFESRAWLYLIDSLRKQSLHPDIRINTSRIRDLNIKACIFDCESGLLMAPLYIPEVVDYQAMFPEQARRESLMRNADVDMNPRWCDVPGLAAQRRERLEIIYHVNMFAQFNDSTSTRWLANHFPNFLLSTFVDFRKEDNDIIDSMVLAKAKNREIGLEALFAEKKLDGGVYIREGLLDYITRHDGPKLQKYEVMFRNFINAYYGVDTYHDHAGRFHKVLNQTYTIKQKRYIVAHLLNTALPLYPTSHNGKFLRQIAELDRGFYQYCIWNGYFDLENLKRGISIHMTRRQSNEWAMIEFQNKDYDPSILKPKKPLAKRKGKKKP